MGRKTGAYLSGNDGGVATSCPRLPVWEDATDRGLVETVHANSRSIVRVTPSGHALLKERRPSSHENLWPVPER
jgi:hypothetical protein